jgi:hypothetical protein
LRYSFTSCESGYRNVYIFSDNWYKLWEGFVNRNPLYSLFNSLHLTKYKESIS